MPPRRPLTPDKLPGIAARHLERYPCTRSRLDRVLRRRIDASLEAHGGDAVELLDAVPGVLDRMEELRFLDDQRFARERAGALHRRGEGRRSIARKLRQQGVPDEVADEALQSLGDEAADPELIAACRLVRRKRLGPLRAPEQRRDRLRRDLATLARAGFGYGIASKVLDCEDEDALDRLEEQAVAGV